MTEQNLLANLQDDDPNAAAAALEANFPDMTKKNKRRKAGSAVLPPVAEAGRLSDLGDTCRMSAYAYLVFTRQQMPISVASSLQLSITTSVISSSKGSACRWLAVVIARQSDCISSSI